MSTDDYTPTTEEMRDYVSIGGEPQPWNPPSRALDDARAAAFDRWLAAHDAEVTEALRTEVARLTLPCDGGCNPNSGPEETCSRHGRKVAEVWEIVSDLVARSIDQDEALATCRDQRTDLAELAEGLTARAEAAEAKIAAVEALADDMARQPASEIAPVRGMATILRAALTDGPRS